MFRQAVGLEGERQPQSLQDGLIEVGAGSFCPLPVGWPLGPLGTCFLLRASSLPSALLDVQPPPDAFGRPAFRWPPADPRAIYPMSRWLASGARCTSGSFRSAYPGRTGWHRERWCISEPGTRIPCRQGSARAGGSCSLAVGAPAAARGKGRRLYERAQVDGEPWSQPPCDIRVTWHGTARVLRRPAQSQGAELLSVVSESLEVLEEEGAISHQQGARILRECADRLAAKKL